MDRRTLLEAVGTAGLAGLSATSGCLGVPGSTATSVTGWRHDAGGVIATVHDGLVFGRRYTGEAGAVFALDAATGEREWAFGESGAFTPHSPLTVDGGVYFGWGDDVGNSGAGALYALDVDGEQRWERDTGSVYTPPRVADGVVYVGSDDGVVRAFGAVDGDRHWRTEDFEGFPIVVGVAETLLVNVEAELVGLDLGDGSVQWRYGEDRDVRWGTVENGGVIYAADGEQLAAVDAGEELWTAAVEGQPRRVAGGHVLVDGDQQVLAVDRTNGDVAWRHEVDGGDLIDPVGDVDGGTLAAAWNEVVAVDVGDWSERWSRSLENGPATMVTVDGTDGSVYVVDDAHGLTKFDPDGERAWYRPLGSYVSDLLVTGRVYVATTDTMYALDPATGEFGETAATDAANESDGA